MSYEDYKLGIEACRKTHETAQQRRRGMNHAGWVLAVFAPVSALASFIAAWTIAVQTDGAVAPALWLGFGSIALAPVAGYMIGATE